MQARFNRFFGPSLFALLLVLLVGLSIHYPSTLWAGDDYSLEFLAATCNLGARINDLTLYPTGAMAYHPAVPFYFFSWLAAFAALGTGAIGSDLAFYDRILDNVPALFVSLKACSIILTACLVLLYRRAASRLDVPPAVIALGLLLYFVETPESLFRSVYPLTETFALGVNALFLIALVRMAHKPTDLWTAVICGLTTAFAYLVKVSFLYVYAGLLIGFVYIVIFSASQWKRLLVSYLTSHTVGLVAVIVVGKEIIGGELFKFLLNLHLDILLHASGSSANNSVSDVAQSISASWQTGATIIPLIIFVSPCLLGIVSIATLRRKISVQTGAIVSGASVASLASVAAILTRYGNTYAVAAAATAPLLLYSAWMVAGSPRVRQMICLVAVCVLAASAYRSIPSAILLFKDKTDTSLAAKSDANEIRRRIKPGDIGLFLYRVSMAGYGKGYVSYFCEVPRITNALLWENRAEQSSMARSAEEPDYIVVDKLYNPTEAAITSGKLLDPASPDVSTYHTGDEIISLDKVWLLIRHKSP